MHTTNQMKMVFPGISVNERTARSLVAAFLVQLDPWQTFEPPFPKRSPTVLYTAIAARKAMWNYILRF